MALAQYVEYKHGFFVDKPMEGVFNFLAILFGAFHTLRYETIRNVPLTEYLKPLKQKTNASLWDMNRYLAEDTILCLQIYCNQGPKPSYIKYLPECKALTDPPMTVDALLRQRRRWNNGGMMANLHTTLRLFWMVWLTNHHLI